MNSSEAHSRLFVGLMSGTSVNSIDAALLRFSDTDFKLLATHEHPLEPGIREQIFALCTPAENEIHRMGILDRRLGEIFGDAVLTLLEKQKIAPQSIVAIGSHGQTVRHNPHSTAEEPAYSMQIGDPNTIAQRTGITTVADFRRRDIALGGQGAPLAPAFHQYAFHNPHNNRCIVNIGGMANITYLPAQGTVTGFDSGPGNVLLDAWIEKQKGVRFDNNGSWAKSGKVNPKIVESLLGEPFFNAPPPKSTGREVFNLRWLEQHLKPYSGCPPEDVMASIVEVTACSLATHIKLFCDSAKAIYVCGGGARNKYLLSRLGNKLDQSSTVSTTEALGIHPDWVEAATFAWLGMQTIDNKHGNITTVTGAIEQAVLGGIYSRW